MAIRAFMRRLCGAIFLAAIAGCAAPIYAPLENWEDFPPVPAGMANVHILRPASSAGSQAWPAVHLNGQRRGILPSAAFTVVSVKPGAYKVTLENEQGKLFTGWPAVTDIEVAAGRRYFILLDVHSDTHQGLSFTGVKAMPLVPVMGEAIRAMRWIHLDEAEGMQQAKFLLYSPAPKLAP